MFATRNGPAPSPLDLLSDAPDGVTETVLSLYGIKAAVTDKLVRQGLIRRQTRELSNKMVRGMKIVRYHITPAGQKARKS